MDLILDADWFSDNRTDLPPFLVRLSFNLADTGIRRKTVDISPGLTRKADAEEPTEVGTQNEKGPPVRAAFFHSNKIQLLNNKPSYRSAKGL
jgi:hypothetical protein